MTAELVAEPPVRHRRLAPRGQEGAPLTAASTVGLGLAVTWLSVLVLLPLAAVVVKATGAGWSGFWSALSRPESLAALRLTLLSSLGVTAVNAVMGTVIAWVLVRDRFRGVRFVEVLIDIPFALPTIVAGLTMLTLYGQHSPIGANLLGTRRGVLIALLFVTLPFVVRSVQPVLEALEGDVEEAAESLGAGPVTIFRRVVLPALAPAIASGAVLAFGRAMGEYGSVILIAGGLDRTQVASSYIYKQIQNYQLAEAAATATVLLVISLVVMSSLAWIQRWVARRG
ncbi:MAG TPA: sulfate ABC transporter permease subunit CysT [Jatrophihabitantaceae bacterium]|nr:sulfate ABC transporter permease subunit CysT [Jatrophihabitantaceae bacterium]